MHRVELNMGEYQDGGTLYADVEEPNWDGFNHDLSGMDTGLPVAVGVQIASSPLKRATIDGWWPLVRAAFPLLDGFSINHSKSLVLPDDFISIVVERRKPLVLPVIQEETGLLWLIRKFRKPRELVIPYEEPWRMRVTVYRNKDEEKAVA